jgi:20S proteasome alpha/beta subunit
MMMIWIPSWPFLVLFVLTTCTERTAVGAAAGSSSSSSSSSYSSIQALDQYGTSLPLFNARQASQQHGTLVLAAISSSQQIVILSLHSSSRPGTIPLSSTSTSLSATKQTMLYSLIPLLNPDTPNNNNIIMMIGTGVKADVEWLRTTLRQYLSQTWERYQDTSTFIWAISHLLLQFMNPTPSYSHAVGLTTTKTPWARPCGVQVLLVQLSSSSSTTTTPVLTLVEPSGVCQDYWAYAMGRDSQVCQREMKLQSKRIQDMTTEDIQEWLVDIVQRKVVNENPTRFGNDEAELWMETVTQHGVERFIRKMYPNDSLPK